MKRFFKLLGLLITLSLLGGLIGFIGKYFFNASSTSLAIIVTVVGAFVITKFLSK